MKFVKSLFLAVVCVCAGCFLFVTDGFAKDADAQCLKGGQYDYCIGGHHCKPCPAECYCEATTATVSCSGLPKIWCNASAQSMWQEAGGGLSNGSFGIKLCPVGFPKTYEDGNFNTGTGKTSKTDCCKKVTILPGKYIHATTGYEEDCLDGFICSGKTDAKVCYNGSQASRGLSACKAGYHYRTSDSSCVRCELGTASDKQGEGNTSCEACHAGTCSTVSGTTCADTKTGATDCLRCPNGYYQNETGKSTCKPCKGQITYDNNGFPINCAGCAVGKYYLGSSCVSADEGYCAAGEDNVCRNGQGNANTQKRCPAGTCSSLDGNKCAGEGQTGASYCITCPAGTTSGDGASYCTPCPEGEYTEDHKSCSVCPADKPYVDEETGECTACEDKKTTKYIDENYCRTCPDFRGLPVGNNYESSKDTENKRYNFEGISSCMYLIKQTYNNKTICKIYYRYDETKSKYVIDSGSNQPWSAENYYVSVKSGVTNETFTCSACPESKPFSDEGTGGIEKCHVCEAGSCISGNSCKKCSAGYKCPGDSSGNATNCGNGFDEYYGEEICPVNSFSNAGATKCTYCAANYTTIGSDGWCSRPRVGKGCGSSLACQMKKTSLCYLNAYDKNSCEEWPSCIIEGKIDKSVLKQQTTN